LPKNSKTPHAKNAKRAKPAELVKHVQQIGRGIQAKHVKIKQMEI
jgi:hypothetical protein